MEIHIPAKCPRPDSMGSMGYDKPAIRAPLPDGTLMEITPPKKYSFVRELPNGADNMIFNNGNRRRLDGSKSGNSWGRSGWTGENIKQGVGPESCTHNVVIIRIDEFRKVHFQIEKGVRVDITNAMGLLFPKATWEEIQLLAHVPGSETGTDGHYYTPINGVKTGGVSQPFVLKYDLYQLPDGSLGGVVMETVLNTKKVTIPSVQQALNNSTEFCFKTSSVSPEPTQVPLTPIESPIVSNNIIPENDPNKFNNLFIYLGAGLLTFLGVLGVYRNAKSSRLSSNVIPSGRSDKSGKNQFIHVAERDKVTGGGTMDVTIHGDNSRETEQLVADLQRKGYLGEGKIDGQLVVFDTRDIQLKKIFPRHLPKTSVSPGYIGYKVCKHPDHGNKVIFLHLDKPIQPDETWHLADMGAKHRLEGGSTESFIGRLFNTFRGLISEEGIDLHEAQLGLQQSASDMGVRTENLAPLANQMTRTVMGHRVSEKMEKILEGLETETRPKTRSYGESIARARSTRRKG